MSGLQGPFDAESPAGQCHWCWPFQKQPVHMAAQLGPAGLLKAGGVTALYMGIG